MLVRLTFRTEPPTVQLDDADHPQMVALLIEGESMLPVARAAFSYFGRIEDDNTAWLNLAALRELAEAKASAETWCAAFDDMVANARAQGGVSDRDELRVAVRWG